MFRLNIGINRSSACLYLQFIMSVSKKIWYFEKMDGRIIIVLACGNRPSPGHANYRYPHNPKFSDKWVSANSADPDHRGAV